MHLLLIKEQLLTGHNDSHYAGGIHLFSCMAETLSQQQQNIHTFSIATKAVVLHYAVTHGLLHSLQMHHTSCCGTEVISWQQHTGLHHHVVLRQQHNQPAATAAAALAAAVADTARELTAQGLSGCAVLDVDMLQHAIVPAVMAPSQQGSQADTHSRQQQQPPAAAAGQGASDQHNEQQQQQERQQDHVPFMLGLWLQLQSCNHIKQAQQQQSVNGTMCDDGSHLQQPLVAVSASSTSSSVAPNETAWRMLVVVQNIHHTPFGPCGTAPRSVGVLQAWRAVEGAICVSDFVRSYMMQHAAPLLPKLQAQHGTHVVHPAAFSVWGPRPFKDLGSAAAARLWGKPERAAKPSNPTASASTCSSKSCSQDPSSVPRTVQGQQACSSSSSMTDCAGPPVAPACGSQPGHAELQEGVLLQQQQQQQQQPQRQQMVWKHPPVVGMLKLTAEKGSALFLALAGQLPDLQFLAVCADPTIQQQVADTGLHNVKLVSPEADVTHHLQHMSLLLVPSILHEAFGMVVLDAMLHGVPVMVAATGALPEAAGPTAAAAVLPMPMVEFPQSTASTCPCADSRPPATPAAHCVDCWVQGERRWDLRVQPGEPDKQHVHSWAAAIVALLSSKEAYHSASRLSRLVAAEKVAEKAPQLEALLQWLQPPLASATPFRNPSVQGPGGFCAMLFD